MAQSESVQPSEDLPQQPNGNMMNMGQGGFQGMGWNGMNPFLSNMLNYQNQMGTFFYLLFPSDQSTNIFQA
jgi:hypothetical protein